jgi:23S rRNA U2552 (ribose-2'-O)-methylase RlmE/FtsJ
MTLRPLHRVRKAYGVIGAFAAGYRYGRRGPAALVYPSGEISDEAPNPLESYFDGVTEGPGIWKWRHYFQIYHRHLARFVGRPVHVCEIGVYSGGSLGMWRNYFGPASQIYGVDIEEACRVYERENVRIFVGDQGDRSFWKRFTSEVPALDVVIDDGSHLAEHQIATLDSLLPNMRPGGVFICEDVHGLHNAFHAYVAGLGTHLHALEGEPTPLQRAVDSIHIYPSVVVIERPEHPVQPFEAPRHGTLWQPFSPTAKGL